MIRTSKRTALVAAMAALSGWCAGAAVVPCAHASNASDVVKNAYNAQKTRPNYYIAGNITVVTNTRAGIQSYSAKITMARKSPGKILLKLDGGMMSMETGSDGEHQWSYVPMMGQYTLTEGGATGAGGSDGALVDFYDNLMDLDTDARFLPDETIAVGGVRFACRVVETVPSVDSTLSLVRGPDTLWVDDTRNVVVRSHHKMTMSHGQNSMVNVTRVEFDEINLTAPPPDGLFVFNPPASAKKVAVLGASEPKPSSWEGEVAPGFALLDLDGKEHRLDAYRGKVVLLDFWATWCKPCRIEFPSVQKLHEKLKARGLVVLAISGETPDKTRPFIQENKYSFAALNDADGGTIKAYKVTTIPQLFVVGKDGTIVAHLVGLHDEAAIREALGKAGIE